MNPKPFWSLKNFTVPSFCIVFILISTEGNQITWFIFFMMEWFNGKLNYGALRSYDAYWSAIYLVNKSTGRPKY